MRRAWARAAGLLLALAAAAAAQQAPATLAQVVAALNQAAPKIHAVSALAQVADYTALVEDTSRSSGTFAFRRTDQGPMYALDLTSPPEAARRLVYRDQTAWVYTPASHEVVKYALKGKQALVDQYLSLGMGASGDELARSFRLRYDGAATLAGVPTVKLTLTPRRPELAGTLTHIVLWYDTRTWIAAQQQIFQQGGDYHLVHYSEVRRNPALPDRVFSTRFPGARVIVPRG
ncbi:MAG TPA: hypothetical protein VMV31_03830 [Terriglobales bacterium]|nr:hypothetical protein [Terriglobales bacterium]